MTQSPVADKTTEPVKQENGGCLRRNNKGCKTEEFYKWPDQPFDDMDSPLAAQQYIQQLVRKDPSDIDEILKLPEGQDLGAWKIEHLRIFCMQLNRLATKLQDCCGPETCNQMTATEQWIFLCAAHKQPNECSAIDYTRHTLDGAASLINNIKYFPSRVTIKESSLAKLGSVFDEFERESHLCKRFSRFVVMHGLMTKEGLIVPADGSKPEANKENSSNTQVISSAGDTTMALSDSTSPEKPPEETPTKQETEPETDKT